MRKRSRILTPRAGLCPGGLARRGWLSTTHGIAAFLALLVLPVISAQADVSILTFRERVQKADLIIVGNVEEKDLVAFGLASLFGDLFTYTRESTVRVERCLKGNVGPGDIVRVRTDNDFRCDVSSLAKGSKYVLMLKDTWNGYYIDVHAGQGTWVVVQLGNERRVHPPSFWDYGGDPLPEFEKWVEWAMSEPAADLAEVVGTATQALALAEQEIANAGINVEGFLLQPVVRDEPDRGYDYLPEFPGFCDDGEVVWCVRWVWPGYTGSWGDPSWTAVHCYVHPLTGDTRIANHPVGRRLTPEELMIVTCGVEKDGTPRALRLTKEEFQEKMNRAEEFGRRATAPALPPDCHLYELRERGIGHGEGMLFLVDDTPKIVFSTPYKRKD